MRELLLLNMFAAPHRPELGARKLGETEIARLLERNAAIVTAEDMPYVGNRRLELCFTAEDGAQTISQLQWLNDPLAQLHRSDRIYPLP
ncbi:MAG TPA: hypothetical protein VKU02_21350 [Gemmataceae bacterium]|nr:hypothetical protein [Gemmataceae bacterium]